MITDPLKSNIVISMVHSHTNEDNYSSVSINNWIWESMIQNRIGQESRTSFHAVYTCTFNVHLNSGSFSLHLYCESWRQPGLGRGFVDYSKLRPGWHQLVPPTFYAIARIFDLCLGNNA
jgi:hypothetical protein